MDLTFVSGNPHLPQVVGGVEVNTHELATELVQRGHRVSVVAKLSLRNVFGVRRAARGLFGGRRTWVDRDLGYPVFRSRRPWDPPADCADSSVAVVQNGGMLELAAGFARIGVPSVAYLHGLGFETWSQKAGSALPFRGYIANSQFTAERLRRAFGLDAVIIPPLFRRERYLTRVEGDAVTFINPVPEKGVDLALSVAALCPEIPFSFVCAWPLGVSGMAMLKHKLRLFPNVTLRRRSSDMRPIYRNTRILMVPSQWEAETWGRVVTEAQFSGIPVVASNRGGLPEAVGAGGLILGYDQPAEIWAEAICDLWSNPARYRELSQAALAHSARPALDPDRQLAILLGALECFVGSAGAKSSTAPAASLA